MLVVLAQNPKGGGLSSQFGGSGTTQLMGVKKTGDFLEKSTWTLVALLLILTLASAHLIPETSGFESISTPNLDNAGQTPAATGFPETTTPTDQDLELLLSDDSTSAE